MHCSGEGRLGLVRAWKWAAGVATVRGVSVKATGAGRCRLDERVVSAAESALAEKHYVSAVDVLVGLGWLPRSRVDEWRQGRVPVLETVVTANLGKVSAAMATFRRWARSRGLTPSETAYVARTGDRRPLRFSTSGDEAIERAYRTHWVSPELSPRRREQLQERLSKAPDLVVIQTRKDWTCARCGTEEWSGSFLLMEEPGPVCLACADLDRLVFLTSGDAALTRRAKRASRLAAVVVRFSTTRRRYERQGILVEEAALQRAEQECLGDEEARVRRRERDEARRLAADAELEGRMVEEIVRLFPGCPRERARAIAAHTAVRGSGRVGRSAAGRALGPEAITLAVAAAVRHEDTRYDEFLMAGIDRAEGRALVREEVDRILDAWRRAGP